MNDYWVKLGKSQSAFHDEYIIRKFEGDLKNTENKTVENYNTAKILLGHSGDIQSVIRQGYLYNGYDVNNEENMEVTIKILKSFEIYKNANK